MKQPGSMKRQNIFSVGLLFCALLSLSFAPAALGQQGARTLIAGTGVVRLGPGQILRITVNGQSGNDMVTVAFKGTYYVGSANGGIWRSSAVAQDTSNPVSLGPADAASTDISQAGYDAVGGEVIIRGYTGTTAVNNGVLFQIINTSTGEVVSAWKDTDIAH